MTATEEILDRLVMADLSLSSERLKSTHSGPLIGEIELLEADLRKQRRGSGTRAAWRCMNSRGETTMCAVPSRQAVFSRR